MQALVCPLRKLLEFFEEGCFLMSNLFSWMIFFYVSDDAFLGLLCVFLLCFLESAEKGLELSLDFCQIRLKVGTLM